MTLKSQSHFRIKIFLSLFTVILTAHLIFLFSCVTMHENKNVPVSSVSEKSKNSNSKIPLTTTSAPLPDIKRLRQPSLNPKFGYPLDYKYRRQLPKKLRTSATQVKSGIIVDMNTRRVIWEKNSLNPVPVASMTKMMTTLLVVEELDKNPHLDLNTPITITSAATNVPRDGVIGLKKGHKFTIEQLMKAMLIRSANDAANQLAAVIGGNVPAFVTKMNRRASQLGLMGANFRNPSGLPDSKRRNSYCSVAGMVLLGERLTEYPNVMNYTATAHEKLPSGESLDNHNGLIRTRHHGADGLKTGFTRAAGFCLTFSVQRNGRRVIGCVTGFDTAKHRDRFCRQLIDWAYSIEK